MAADWNRIVREHGPRVFAAAWRVLGHAADAEDVAQQAFLEAHRIHKTNGVANWEALLMRLATCRALDRLRQRKPTIALHDVSLIVSTNEPVAEAIGHELEQRLRQAVRKLPEREAAVFCFRCFEDLSYDQIAETLQISRGAVATALHKARAKLEKLLAEPIKRK